MTMRPTHSAHTGMCVSLEPKRIRRGIPTWWYCGFTGKEVDPKTKPCTRDGCKDFRVKGEAPVAQAKLNWDGPACAVIDGADGTLREWAKASREDGMSLKRLGEALGTTADNVYQALRKIRDRAGEPVQKTRKATSGSCEDGTQPAPDPKREIGICWSCGGKFPADTMHPDGDTLECPDCYRNAHEPRVAIPTVSDGVERESTLGPDSEPQPSHPVRPGEVMIPLDCARDLVRFCGGEFAAEENGPDESWGFVCGWLACQRGAAK